MAVVSEAGPEGAGVAGFQDPESYYLQNVDAVKAEKRVPVSPWKPIIDAWTPSVAFTVIIAVLAVVSFQFLGDRFPAGVLRQQPASSFDTADPDEFVSRLESALSAPIEAEEPSFEERHTQGYEHAKAVLDRWQEINLLANKAHEAVRAAEAQRDKVDSLHAVLDMRIRSQSVARDQLDRARADAATVITALRSLRESERNLKDECSKLQAKAVSLLEAKKAADADVALTSKRKREHKEVVSTLKATVDDIEQGISERRARLDTLKRSIADFGAKVRDIETQLAATHKEIAQLRASIAKSQQTITAQTENVVRMHEYRDAIAGYQDRIRDMLSRDLPIGSVSSAIVAEEQAIERLEAEIRSLDERTEADAEDGPDEEPGLQRHVLSRRKIDHEMTQATLRFLGDSLNVRVVGKDDAPSVLSRVDAHLSQHESRTKEAERQRQAEADHLDKLKLRLRVVEDDQARLQAEQANAEPHHQEDVRALKQVEEELRDEESKKDEETKLLAKEQQALDAIEHDHSEALLRRKRLEEDLGSTDEQIARKELDESQIRQNIARSIAEHSKRLHDLLQARDRFTQETDAASNAAAEVNIALVALANADHRAELAAKALEEKL
ncbi:Uncharacterized protein PBTT_06892 [Plasmodiophora brassicae]